MARALFRNPSVWVREWVKFVDNILIMLIPSLISILVRAYKPHNANNVWCIKNRTKLSLKLRMSENHTSEEPGIYLDSENVWDENPTIVFTQ